MKRGKGSQRQKDVALMAESTPLENIKTKKKSSHLRYVKMKVLKAKDADEINKTIVENIDEKSIILSDKAKTYIDLNTLKFTSLRNQQKNNINHFKMDAYYNSKCKTKFFRNIS